MLFVALDNSFRDSVKAHHRNLLLKSAEFALKLIAVLFQHILNLDKYISLIKRGIITVTTCARPYTCSRSIPGRYSL